MAFVDILCLCESVSNKVIWIYIEIHYSANVNLFSLLYKPVYNLHNANKYKLSTWEENLYCVQDDVTLQNTYPYKIIQKSK